MIKNSVAAVDVHAEIVGPSADDDTRKNVVKWRERHCLGDPQCDMKERRLCFQSLATCQPLHSNLIWFSFWKSSIFMDGMNHIFILLYVRGSSNWDKQTRKINLVTPPLDIYARSRVIKKVTTVSLSPRFSLCPPFDSPLLHRSLAMQEK